MGDLISRQAAIDALRTCQTYLFDERDPDKKISLESAEYEIEQLPPAQPKIIYCKDCKKHNVEFGYADEICPLISIRGKAKEHEFDYQYCVYGKRK